LTKEAVEFAAAPREPEPWSKKAMAMAERKVPAAEVEESAGWVASLLCLVIDRWLPIAAETNQHALISTLFGSLMISYQPVKARQVGRSAR
jgi:hypothetical protein